MGSRQKMAEAANELVAATVAALKNDRGVHAETAIAAVARMAGTFLFRSFGFQLRDLKPGEYVLSEQANEQGSRLVQVLAGVLARLGVQIEEAKLSAQPGPENQSQMAFLETQKLLEPKFNEI